MIENLVAILAAAAHATVDWHRGSFYALEITPWRTPEGFARGLVRAPELRSEGARFVFDEPS